jgi:hypothetical protein
MVQIKHFSSHQVNKSYYLTDFQNFPKMKFNVINIIQPDKYDKICIKNKIRMKRSTIKSLQVCASVSNVIPHEYEAVVHTVCVYNGWEF